MDWTNLALFALLTIGHTELLVAIVNRSHALPLKHERLSTIRHLHDLLVPLFPCLLIGAVGLGRPPAVTRRKLERSLTVCHRVLRSFAIGLAGLLVALARHWLHKTPALLLESQSTVVDAAAINSAAGSSQPLDGDGPHRRLLRVPFNQVFEFDICEKTLHHPRLPVEWDGLTLWHLSDWHFTGTPAKPFYEQVTAAILSRPADLAIFSGDLLDRDDLLDWVACTVGQVALRSDATSCSEIMTVSRHRSGPTRTLPLRLDRCRQPSAANRTPRTPTADWRR